MTIPSKPQIEAIQSVTACRVTDPRVTRRVVPGFFRRSFNTLLYFTEVEEEYARVFVGQMKESLGKAFAEQPLICGRIRKTEDEGLEIMSNDSGIRLIEGKIGIGLKEFLESEGREEAESELVHWKDIEEQDPQFSPLLYIQVTKFECGGYSLGITCSLLLADPFAITSFLKRWATIHSNLFAKENGSKENIKPIFYLYSPNDAYSSSSSGPFGPNPCWKSAKTVIFKVEGEIPESDYRSVVLHCTEEAETELKSEMGPTFPMAVKDPLGAMETENITRNNGFLQPQVGLKGRVSRASWDGLGASALAFREGKEPVCVSHWIGSPDGFVMVASSPDASELGSYVFVTI